MPFFSAYPVEQHLSGSRTEASGEDLAVVGEDLIGHAVGARGRRQGATGRPGRGSGHHEADTQNREWSSTPVTILASVPSASA